MNPILAATGFLLIASLAWAGERDKAPQSRDEFEVDAIPQFVFGEDPGETIAEIGGGNARAQGYRAMLFVKDGANIVVPWSTLTSASPVIILGDKKYHFVIKSKVFTGGERIHFVSQIRDGDKVIYNNTEESVAFGRRGLGCIERSLRNIEKEKP